MKILIKFPSRQRPHKFFTCLNKYLEFADGPVDVLITADKDDHSMNNNIAKGQIFDLNANNKGDITIKYGDPLGKIDAINRDLEDVSFDILILASDDMECVKEGWDTVLINEMEKYYPDTDGVLWHNDGYTKNRLNTMCIMGREYYNRFGYIYHHSYKSLWCDNEFMDVSQQLGKVTYFEEVLFAHQHPANVAQYQDDLYEKNNIWYDLDHSNYEIRKANGFEA